MGRIGLSREEFCECTFAEFEAIARGWQAEQTAQMQSEWERTRLLAAILIQPHVKGRITPQKLLPLPWDTPKGHTASAPRLTAAERKARFEELVKKLGKSSPTF